MKEWKKVGRFEFSALPYRITASRNPAGGDWYNVYCEGVHLGRVSEPQEARDLAELHELSERG